MSEIRYSAALTREVDAALRTHLLRSDGQEDICFAIWHPSTGASRTSALVRRLILPEKGDRSVHGNASFHPQYFERALAEAAAAGGGLAMLHSHPMGRGWQGMSRDDVSAEHGHAASAFGATGLPFVGLTLAGDGAWSARFWPRVAPRTYERKFCDSVRVVGDLMTPHFYDEQVPVPETSRSQIRTVSAWGHNAQGKITRLRVAIIGAGSVGGMIAEAMARTGVADITLVDFDRIEEHNLDRLVYATAADIGELKVLVLARHLRLSATAADFSCRPVVSAVYEEEGLRAALDCDVIFSCVDRPWGRYALNAIAYAHLIPVFDGGIAARANKSGSLVAADWRAHTCAPGRACMACLGQYSPGHVQAEREGLLDDPRYIDGLANDHPLKARENVFAFSMACASLQSLQMLYSVIAPLGLPGPLPQLYHSVGGDFEPGQKAACDDECPFSPLVATGDHFPYAFIRAIDPAKLTKFHDRWFKPNNATLVISGDTSLAEIRPMVEAAFGKWQRGAVPERIVPLTPPAAKPVVYLIDKPGAPQSVITASVIAPRRVEGDNASRGAFITAIGGSFTSRINMKLREEKGCPGWALNQTVASSPFGSRPGRLNCA